MSGTTWSEVPGVGYWKWWKPMAQNLGLTQYNLWRGAIQPWELPAGAQMEAAARRGTAAGVEELMRAGNMLNLNPELRQRALADLSNAATTGLMQGYERMRSAEHPAEFLLNQQKLAQGLIGLGLQLKQLQTMQDAMNASSGSGLGSILGSIGQIAGMILPQLIPGLGSLSSLGLGSLSGGTASSYPFLQMAPYAINMP